MHTTLKAFLAATHEDKLDQIAQRAMRLHEQMHGQSGLRANAWERGDAEAYTDVSHAHAACGAVITLINKAKKYPFAEDVLAQMPEFGIKGEIDDTEKFGEAIVTAAEQCVKLYAERCRPVCSIRGISSVRILRGAHALAAMRGLEVANSNAA